MPEPGTGVALPISSKSPAYAPAPLSLRTDAIGIFLVLFVAGVAAIIAPDTNRVNGLLAPFAVYVWEFTLVVGGGLGIFATLVVGHRTPVVGLALEAIARVALASAALVYGAALYEARGLAGGFSVLVYMGIATLLVVGAFQIGRWLLAQRRALDAALEELEGGGS